jgi:flagellar biogenesis protein FliO
MKRLIGNAERTVEKRVGLTQDFLELWVLLFFFLRWGLRRFLRLAACLRSRLGTGPRLDL